jgi:hypothetical protein
MCLKLKLQISGVIIKINPNSYLPIVYERNNTLLFTYLGCNEGLQFSELRFTGTALNR